MIQRVYYAQVVATGDYVPWDPAYMSNNPAFRPVSGIPEPIQKAAARAKQNLPATPGTPKRPPDDYMRVLPDDRSEVSNNEVVIPNPKGYDETEMRTTFQSFDDGAQTIAGSQPQDISNSTLPNRTSATPPTPAHVPPAVAVPTNHVTPQTPETVTIPPPPSPPPLASSLPPPPMTVPVAAPQQLERPNTLPPVRRPEPAG